MSRKHLEIKKLQKQQYHIRDLGSFGGTYFQGKRITEAEVNLNDVIQIAHTPIRVVRLAAHFAEQTLNEETEQGTVMMQMVSITIGRESPAQFILNHPVVSRMHCELRMTPQGLMIRDLKSSNGTFLNGRKINDWTFLKSEDDLSLGTFRVPTTTRERWLIQLSSSQDRALLHRYEGEIPENGILRIGRSKSSDIVVDHPTISNQHARLVIKDKCITVHDMGSENGTYVNGRPITKSPLSPQDSLRLGAIKTMIFPNGLLQDINANTKIQLDVNCVSRHLSNGVSILNDISLSIYPGEIVALMGPSGAGKTSLLEVLTGKTAPSSGSILFNGDDLYSHFERLSSAMGYVPQQDLIHGDLTVFEELMFAARMRLPTRVPINIVQNQVERVLTEIGLAHIRDSIIGDEMNRGISGGQKKRVNIAIELLTEPAVLFLDEPTSGLDATSTLEVMHTLRSLADNGKTIIMTIHQPRVEAFHLMDNLILLSKGGHLAYYGPIKEDAVVYVSAVSGREMAPGINPADFVVDSLENPAKPLAPEAWVAAYRASNFHRHFVVERQNPEQNISQSKIYEAERPSYLRQTGILTNRYFFRKQRDLMALMVQLLQAVVIGLLLSLLFHRQGFDLSNLEIKPTLEKLPFVVRFLQLDNGIHPTLFLISASAFWLGCNNVAREVVSARPILSRERRSGLNSAAYISSIFVAQMLIAVVQMGIILAFVWTFVRPSSAFALPYLMTILTSSVGICTGLFISSTARSEVSAISTVPLVLIPQLLLGGYIKIYGRLQNDAIQNWAADLMPIRWSFEALSTLEYDAVQKLNKSLHGIDSTIGFSSGVEMSCAVLMAMSLSLLIASWLQLRRSI